MLDRLFFRYIMILALETSAEPASIAIRDDEGLIITHTFDNHNQVNVPLADEIEELLSKVSPSQIEVVIVGSGPGSYSGARVGLATAEAVALVNDCPVVTLPSIYGIHEGRAEMTLIGDARRGGYFICKMTTEKDAVKVYDKEQFISEVMNLKSGLVTFEEVNKLPLPEHLDVTITHSSATVLITSWEQMHTAQQARLIAAHPSITYLRPPHITQAKNPFA